MYCVKCGNKIGKNDKFCTKCGNSVLEDKTNKVEVTSNNSNNDSLSIILGVISLVTFWIPIVGIVCAIIAIISGKKYKKSTNKSSSGAVLGIVGLVLSILTILFMIFIFFIAFLTVSKKDTIEDNVHKYIDKYDDKYGDTYDKDDEYDEEEFSLSGKILHGSDNSVLYLNNDNTYSWYMNDKDHDDNYYSGTYSYYNGLEAISYIIKNFSEYGLTYDKQMDFFGEGKYKIDDYYVLVLNCNNVVINGKSDDKAKGIIPYYGFYDDDEYTLSMINMKTGDNTNFTIDAKNSKKGIL